MAIRNSLYAVLYPDSLNAATRLPRRRPVYAATLGRVVGTALAAALLFRTFGYEAFAIPSGSMMPTLLAGDTVLVSKFSYGFSRYSLPIWHPLSTGRWFNKLPKRGDIVVFKLPRDPTKDYIKRVAGLPGDRIQMIAGVPQVNGVPVPQERIADFETDADGPEMRMPQDAETLPGGTEHAILEIGDKGMFDDTPVWTVPAGDIFVLGDNRRASEDSRSMDAVGFVPLENIVGRAEIRLFSLSGGVQWWEIWRWPHAMRIDRVLNVIR